MIEKSRWLKGLFFVVATGAIACGEPGAEEDVGATRQAIVRGDSLDRAARPYEESMVSVTQASDLHGGCSATLLGNQGIARYALTARHCFHPGHECVSEPVPMSDIRIVRREGDTDQILAMSKNIVCHPDAFTPSPDTVDVILIELDRDVPLSTRQYFTNLAPSDLVGETSRCYGGGSQDNSIMTTGLFEIIRASSGHNRALAYNLVNPNADNQRLGSGDSGGVCVRANGTTSMTIYGVHKAGSTTSFTDTAAVAFSDWVRTFVPR